MLAVVTSPEFRNGQNWTEWFRIELVWMVHKEFHRPRDGNKDWALESLFV
jgi:hypothetical protein